VEGTVTDFTAGDQGGHTDENWSVTTGGRKYHYRYNRSSIVPGFHASAGPIHDRIRVRLADVNGNVARLEAARP
jgi:hypothetical protein